MSYRHFDSGEKAELRAKIDEAKRRLPLPRLMHQLGLAEHAKKVAHCPWHDDEHPSFSMFESKDGKGWQWKCHAACGSGDEIAVLMKYSNISRREAIKRYLEMAGFPTFAPKSLEYRKSPESPEYPQYPVSNGQGLDQELKLLAGLYRCTARNTARTKRWPLLRDLKAVEKRNGRKLTTSELTMVFDEWYRCSKPFLDPIKSRDDYLAAFLGEFGKVRVATGEGETLKTAQENVAKLWVDGLPVIPGYPDAPESWRRLLALHCELSRLSANGTYFLSYRDAADICAMTHQTAYNITAALVTLGALEIVEKGKAGLVSRKAAVFRYLLENTATRINQEEEEHPDEAVSPR